MDLEPQLVNTRFLETTYALANEILALRPQITFKTYETSLSHEKWKTQ